MNIPEFFNALYSEKEENKQTISVQSLSFDVLPPNEVIIKVHYTSLNYKDALSAKGLNHVTRSYPHIPGIDAAGVILDDSSNTFKRGDHVVVTGNDLGTNTFGGFGEIIRVPREWVIPLSQSMSLKQTMIYGTAGFTAMYGIERLTRELITPDSGPILVTGATGGVGSLAVFFLSKLGFSVIAATRKIEQRSFLEKLGAKKVIHSDEIINVSSSPLLSRKWAGAIETVGGSLLDAVLRQTQDKGAVACCGNILGKELETNIYPFILRGISLLGIDSAFCEFELRKKIWQQMAMINAELLPDSFHKVIYLDELEPEIDRILKGEQIGRVVLKH
ncbi:MAG: YhdH/YhfP family quinone oxidoreductase [Balneolaceae bacterium]